MTNVTHKFLSMYLFLFITLYMFRAHRAHHHERQIVSTQPLVTVCVGGRVVSSLVIYQESLHDAWSTKYKILLNFSYRIYLNILLNFLEFTASLSITILIYVWYVATVFL
jgi:hypothetical protein